MKLKIAVIVHGRFYAFDLVRELLSQGHEVTLFTNYPKFIVEKFGIPKNHVRSFLLHGILSRILNFLHSFVPFLSFEPFLHSWFSTWAAQSLCQAHYDVVHVFSGIAEELLKSLHTTNTLKTLARGSAHILTQSQLLVEEEKRAKISIDKPSEWIISREEREYQLADITLILSTFAQKTFIQQGFQSDKLKLLPLGTQLSLFRPEPQIIEARCQRIINNQPLRVLMVGTFSLRKGAIDFLKIASMLGSFFSFRFVGQVTNEVQKLASESNRTIEFIPRIAEFELPLIYNWADIFIFTTIEDGYAVVLSQAQASGLPILATTNCSAPDMVIEGKTGWIVPIRSPEAFLERLQWCNEHREELVQMVRRVYDDFKPRDWADVAADFTAICQEILSKQT